MHTLKEILTEPQTMYDGGVVGMADGGPPEDQKKVLEARQKIEQIEVPEEQTPTGTGTGTSLTPYATKLGKGLLRQAMKRVPFVNLFAASPAGEGSTIYTPEEHAELLAMTKTARRWPTTKVYNTILDYGIKDKSILNFGSGDQSIIDASKGLEQISNRNEVTNYDISLGNNEVLNKKYDVVMASNVLNVQPNIERLDQTINELSNTVNDEGQIIFNLPSSPRKEVYDDLTTKQAKDMLTKKFEEQGIKGNWKGEIFTGNKTSDITDVNLPGFKDELINQAIKNSDFYHGTTATELKGGKFKASKEGVLGTGVYVTPDPDYAASYSKGQGGNIHAVKVNIETPLIVRIKGSFSDYAPARVLEELGVETKKAFDLAEKWSEELGGDVTTQFKSRAVKQGYDSIVLVNDETNIIQEIVAFNPDQIVSKFKSMYDGGIVNMQDGGKLPVPKQQPLSKLLRTAVELGAKRHPVGMIARAVYRMIPKNKVSDVVKFLKDTPAHELFGLEQSGSQYLEKFVNDFTEGLQTTDFQEKQKELQLKDPRRTIRTELPKTKLMYDGGLV